MAKTLFFKLMNEKYGRAKNLSRLIYLNSVERTIFTKLFGGTIIQGAVARGTVMLEGIVLKPY